MWGIHTSGPSEYLTHIEALTRTQRRRVGVAVDQQHPVIESHLDPSGTTTDRVLKGGGVAGVLVTADSGARAEHLSAHRRPIGRADRHRHIESRVLGAIHSILGAVA